MPISVKLEKVPVIKNQIQKANCKRLGKGLPEKEQEQSRAYGDHLDGTEKDILSDVNRSSLTFCDMGKNNEEDVMSIEDTPGYKELSLENQKKVLNFYHQYHAYIFKDAIWTVFNEACGEAGKGDIDNTHIISQPLISKANFSQNDDKDLIFDLEYGDLEFKHTKNGREISSKGTVSMQLKVNDDYSFAYTKDSEVTFSNPHLKTLYTESITSEEQFLELVEKSTAYEEYASAKQTLDAQIKELSKSENTVVQQQAQAAKDVLDAVENSQQDPKSGVSVAQATQVLEDTSALMQANIDDFDQKSKNYQQSIKPMMTHKLGAAKKIGMAMLGFLGATALVAAVAVATVATAGVGLAVAGLSLVASAASLSAAASIYTRHKAKAENSADPYKSFVTASDNRYFKRPKSGEQVDTNNEENQPNTNNITNYNSFGTK